MNAGTTLMDTIRVPIDTSWARLDQDRQTFQREFARLVVESPQLAGQVLDIGCGPNLPLALASIQGQLGRLDGVDPSPEVAEHPLLQQHWQSTLENSAVPAEAYDLAYAYNVLEHLAVPRPFFKKLHMVLKPGGIFWALTPNAVHPFALLSRSIERIGLKPLARRKIGRDETTGQMAVNDYPAYYRCNTPAAVSRAIRGLGFKSATFYFLPSIQWDTYFPRWLKWAPHLYDACLGVRLTAFMLIFVVRLEK